MKSNSSIFVLIVSIFIITFIIFSYVFLTDSYFTDTENIISNKNKNYKNYNCNVYHVDGYYTYDEAKEVCKKRNGRLANIYEMNDAYKNGAHWCKIGWTKEQMGMYPIQESKAHNNFECGKPGLNGQYYPYKNYKFGANCINK